MPPPTLRVTLDPDAQAELERRYHTTRDAQTRTLWGAETRIRVVSRRFRTIRRWSSCSG